FGKFQKLELWMDIITFQSLDSNQRMDLYYLLAADSEISLIQGGNLELIEVGEVLAITWKDDMPITYASKEKKAVLFDEIWGDTQGSMLIKSTGLAFNLQGVEVNRNDLIPVRG